MVDTGSGSAPIVDMGAYERQADSDPAGITIQPASGLTTAEAGGSASFTVVLDTQPHADVSAAPVLIQIEADVVVSQPILISNQAQVHYDSDGDGTSDATRLSTDPALAGDAEPTVFQFGGTTPVMIPVNDPRVLFGLALLMMLAAGGALMRRRS